MPRCFDSRKQWYRWRVIAISDVSSLNSSAYCADCTPEYQARMIRAGRCEHPGTVFAPDEDGLITGTRPIKEAA